MRKVSDKKKTVQKIKSHNLCSKTLSRKSCRLSDSAENYGTARQATITRRMCISCCITTSIDTHIHSEYVIIVALECACVMLPSVLSAVQYFSTFYHKRQDFQKQIEYKLCFHILYNFRRKYFSF